MTFPLNGVRVLDFTWLNAGAKGTRHLALYGADVIHIEWKGRLDLLRHNPPYHEVPGDTSMPKAAPGYDHLKVSSVNRAASFNNNHVGKWGISLNLRHPKGKAIFRDLVKTADVVADNFTASTLDGWGFGPEALEQIKPDIIYVQAPGFGRLGPYSDYRSYGPTAAAISGLTWQGGLPDRYPCGYGFSYMDVCGPYFLAIAVLSALRQRNRTGRGVYVDSSQCGPAFLLTGPALLEWSANGDGYVRNGNRSTYVAAAPHNAYRCKGKDDWVVITCFTEEALARAGGRNGESRMDRPRRVCDRRRPLRAPGRSRPARRSVDVGTGPLRRHAPPPSGGRARGGLPEHRRPVRARPTAAPPGLLRPRPPLGSAAVRHGGASGALLGHAALAVGTVG